MPQTSLATLPDNALFAIVACPFACPFALYAVVVLAATITRTVLFLLAAGVTGYVVGGAISHLTALLRLDHRAVLEYGTMTQGPSTVRFEPAATPAETAIMSEG